MQQKHRKAYICAGGSFQQKWRTIRTRTHMQTYVHYFSSPFGERVAACKITA